MANPQVCAEELLAVEIMPEVEICRCFRALGG